jgi:hypothetical protein
MKAFPDNTEIETRRDLREPMRPASSRQRDARRRRSPAHPPFVPARAHGYTPRLADPRIGVSSIDFRDYAKPFNENTEVEWITRWRLEKKDPSRR